MLATRLTGYPFEPYRHTTTSTAIKWQSILTSAKIIICCASRLSTSITTPITVVQSFIVVLSLIFRVLTLIKSSLIGSIQMTVSGFVALVLRVLSSFVRHSCGLLSIILLLQVVILPSLA